MNKFPVPPPDRRIQGKAQTSVKPNEDEVFRKSSEKFELRQSTPIRLKSPEKDGTFANIPIYEQLAGAQVMNNNNQAGKRSTSAKNNVFMFSEVGEKEETDKFHNQNLLKMKHIEDMRNNILSYKLLNDKKMFLSSNISNITINKCNIIIFGPSGSGKSSFIRSLYRALYGTQYLPPEAMNKLVIKDSYSNEGTVCFTRLHLKEESNQSSGIIVCDTRGHIQMNDSEKEQFKVIIEGRVKDDVEVVQKVERNPLKLWEFWKKESELFPLEIFNATEPGLDSLPHIIVLVFDGSTDQVIEAEDEEFYQELIEMSIKKGYTQVHVILTRIDMFEKIINEKTKNLQPTERATKLNTLKDQKIERVIDILNVKRSNVHFIENYHSDIEENIIEIDYHILKTLVEIINICEQFIICQLTKSESCLRCF